MPDESRRACTGCGHSYDLAELVRDVDFVPIGMQFEDPDQQFNFYFFNHECPNCGTTILIPVLDFLPFIAEPVPDLVRTGMEDCGRHCTRIEDLSECRAQCRYAPFRRYLLLLKARREAAVRRASRDRAA